MGKSKGKDRIGKETTGSYGSSFELIQYNHANSILAKSEYGDIVHTSWQAFRNGEIKSVYDMSVYGIGYLGEGKYKTRYNYGKYIPQYITWRNMLGRCYSEYEQTKRPTYIGCSVVKEWHNFQVFAEWYDKNYYEVDGERMSLEKDILFKGNKIYSPETCIFAPLKINDLFNRQPTTRGDLPIGVYYDTLNKKYKSQCQVIGKSRIGLGYFDTPKEAFEVYKIHKEKYIKEIAEIYKEKIPQKLYTAMLNYVVEIGD